MVMRAWDGRGKPTLLTRLVLEALQVPSEEELILQLHHEAIDAAAILNLVPLLFEAAMSGDSVAGYIVVRMGT